MASRPDASRAMAGASGTDDAPEPTKLSELPPVTASAPLLAVAVKSSADTMQSCP